MKTDLGDNNQRAALFASPPMSFQERKAAREKVNEAIVKLKGTNKDTENIKELAKNFDGTLIVDVSQYSDIKSSMD